MNICIYMNTQVLDQIFDSLTNSSALVGSVGKRKAVSFATGDDKEGQNYVGFDRRLVNEFISLLLEKGMSTVSYRYCDLCN